MDTLAQSSRHHVYRNGGIELIETIAVFERKPTRLQHKKCVIEKVVELSQEEYWQFYNNLLDDQTFIEENKDCMYQDEHGTMHCLLVMGENMEDGVLVESEGLSYARYAAVLPNARLLWNMEQHPVLKTQYENALSMYDYCAEKALSDHQDGVCRILVDDVLTEDARRYLSSIVLEDMLQENPDFENVELIDDELFITIAKQTQENTDVGISM